MQTKMGVSRSASRSSCSTAAERSSYSAGKTVFTGSQHMRMTSAGRQGSVLEEKVGRWSKRGKKERTY